MRQQKTKAPTTPGVSKTSAPGETSSHFTPEALKFLRGLKRNNRRDWFDPRKAVFERELRAPMLQLIEEVNHAMTGFAPAHVRPPQKTMMRIYRDTRFSANKAPYKSNVAAWWARAGLEKTSGGGYYFHLSPEEIVIAAGVYMPEREQLFAIRTYLLDHHQEARRLCQSKALRRSFDLDNGEPLSRPPKGFPKDHPALDLLKCRQWAVVAKLPAEAALDPRLSRQVIAYFRLAAPLVDFLNRPLTASPGKPRKVLFGLY